MLKQICLIGIVAFSVVNAFGQTLNQVPNCGQGLSGLYVVLPQPLNDNEVVLDQAIRSIIGSESRSLIQFVREEPRHAANVVILSAKVTVKDRGGSTVDSLSHRFSYWLGQDAKYKLNNVNPWWLRQFGRETIDYGNQSACDNLNCVDEYYQVTPWIKYYDRRGQKIEVPISTNPMVIFKVQRQQVGANMRRRLVGVSMNFQSPPGGISKQELVYQPVSLYLQAWGVYYLAPDIVARIFCAAQSIQAQQFRDEQEHVQEYSGYPGPTSGRYLNRNYFISPQNSQPRNSKPRKIRPRY